MSKTNFQSYYKGNRGSAREILQIAVPAIVANIVTPLLALADVMITGHIGQGVYLAAIALGGTVFNIFYWIFNFLRMGTTGLTAQAYGANDSRTLTLTLYRSLMVAFGIAALILPLQRPLSELLFNFMDADPDSSLLAREYFSILIWGAPAVMGTYALSGWLLGMQNSRAQMVVAISTNLINVLASLLLVFGFSLQLRGVAFGTLIAQWSGFLIALLIVARKYRLQSPSLGELLDPAPLLRFFRINTDIFLRTLCLVAVTTWFTHAGAIQGNATLAANSLLLQLFMLFSYFMDGFAFAGEALAGKHTGAGNQKELTAMIHTLFLIGIACASIFSISYLTAGIDILSLFTNDHTVVTTAVEYLPWAIAIPLCGFQAFIWDGVFVGLVRTRGMLAALLAALIVFFTIYFTSPRTNTMLWLAFNAYLLTRGIVQGILYRAKP